MKKNNFFILSTVLVFLGLFHAPLSSLAADNNGGQGTVNGGITFYEDSSTTPSSTTESSKVVTPSPKGSFTLPKTGEPVAWFIPVCGFLILVSVGSIYFRKKKQEE